MLFGLVDGGLGVKGESVSVSLLSPGRTEWGMLHQQVLWGGRTKYFGRLNLGVSLGILRDIYCVHFLQEKK